ncbi:MAG: hypothetical protein JST68_09550 [Bacteroidetes bacterium]|nr:hypothetical protein [Bacteroidota bacterium]
MTIFFRPAKEPYLKYLSIFLLINFLMEAGLGFLALSAINNVFLNNIETLLVVSFDLFLVREIVVRKSAKTVFIYVLTCYPLFALIDIFFIQPGLFHTISYGLGCLLVVAACMYYFWELFQQRSSPDLVRQPAFWICSGLLFFYTCTFPIYGFTKLMQALPTAIIENLVAIFVLLNILLYLSFTIAYLCRLKTWTSMSSS